MSVVAGTHAMQTRSLTGKLWWLLPPAAALLYPLALRALHESGGLLHRTRGPNATVAWLAITPGPLSIRGCRCRLSSGDLRRISLQHRSFAQARTGANEISSSTQVSSDAGDNMEKIGDRSGKARSDSKEAWPAKDGRRGAQKLPRAAR
jgi:hypothetical protein